MKLIKDDFGYYDGDKDLDIPEELSIIKRGYKAKEISDKILENQKLRELIEHDLSLQPLSVRDAEEHSYLNSLLRKAKERKYE